MDVNYDRWLRRQPVAFQNDVLGVAKGKLFRQGGLTLDRFISRAGDELTLEQLREREFGAWENAGL
jgi:Na+-transporting NADH:ubiquinone oxidoreductase subunit NqrA